MKKKLNNELPRCPICKGDLAAKLSRGRKSGKPFIMLICPKDGRHFRGFITDRAYVEGVMNIMEDKTKINNGVPDGH
jgi:uncharacterized protein YbaR (Trm112 family)